MNCIYSVIKTYPATLVQMKIGSQVFRLKKGCRLPYSLIVDLNCGKFDHLIQIRSVFISDEEQPEHSRDQEQAVRGISF